MRTSRPVSTALRAVHPRISRIARPLAAATLALGTVFGLAACDSDSTASSPAPSGSDSQQLSEQEEAAQRAAQDAESTPAAQPSATSAQQEKKAARSGESGAKLGGGSALALLEKLTVKGKAPASGYDRTRWFGKAWAYDYDGNGCRTRDDILARDMTNVKYAGGSTCKVASGTLHDPYDGKTDSWRIGKNSVDIDHLVALQNAWVSGAQYWKGAAGQRQRESIANDPLNLIAADASLNRTKGAANAAEWLPANRGFRCQYVATQISVKYKYSLSVTSAEKGAMKRVLSGCTGQKAAEVAVQKVATGKSVAGQATKKAKASSKSSSSSHKSSSKSGGSSSSKSVHPGAFCKPAGATGVGSNGHTYTCKSSSTESRNRWRR